MLSPEVLDPGTDSRPNTDIRGVSHKVASKESGINHEEIVEASPAIPTPSLFCRPEPFQLREQGDRCRKAQRRA